MRRVVRLLRLAAARRFVDGALHAARDRVRIHDDVPLGVARGAADSLDEGGLTAQESLFVCVEDGDQLDFGHIQPFAQKVDAAEHVELAAAQAVDDVDALQGVDIAVHIAHADAIFLQKIGEAFRHALGEGGDEGAAAALRRLFDLAQKVVDLPLDGAHLDLWIQQPRGADDLFHHLPRLFQLVLGGRSGDADHLRHAGVELLKGEGAVVVGGAHAEAVVDQVCLARQVAVVHGADLRNGHVAFVDKHEEVIGEVIEESERRFARPSAVEIAAVIFHAAAIADLAHHLDVVTGALFEALRFQQLAVVAEGPHFVFEIALDGGERRLHLGAAHGVVAGGEDTGVLELRRHLARDHLFLAEAVDLVAEKFDADGDLGIAGGEDLHDVAAHAEGRAGKVDILALVLQLDQAAEEVVARHRVAGAQGDGEVEVLFRRAQAVDAGDGGDDEHVAALAQRGGGGVAQLVDLVVHRHVLFDIGIGAGDVAFRLVIVVIGHEVFDAVMGEEGAELVAKLRRQRLVVGDDQRGAVDVLDDVGHRERLAAARDADQHLGADAVLYPFGQFLDRLRLIARGAIGRNELEALHAPLLFSI